MKNYNNYEVNDWLEDHAFQSWVYYKAGEEVWQQFLKVNSHQESNIEQAKRILLSIRGELESLGVEEVESRVSEILEAIPARGSKLPGAWFSSGWLQLAASVLLLVGLGWAAFTYKKAGKSPDPYHALIQNLPPESLEEIVNDTDKTMLVNLPDGSSVLLKQNSRISFPHQSDSRKREIYLSGEAFFEVQKTPEKPFFVYANEMVTKVLGTSFSIRAYRDEKEVRVVVKSGKVSVFAHGSPQEEVMSAGRSLRGMVLVPNQQATLRRTNLEIVRTVVDRPVLLRIPIENQNFNFKRTPVQEVFRVLEKAYGVDILFDEEVVENCTITAALGDEPLFEKLNMIAAAMESTYETLDGQVIIYSKGCK